MFVFMMLVYQVIFVSLATLTQTARTTGGRRCGTRDSFRARIAQRATKTSPACV